MDRRSMIGTAVAALTGSAVGARVTESRQDETAVFILHLSEEYLNPSENDLAMWRARWKQTWEDGGHKAPVLLIVPPGCVLAGEGNAWMGETLSDYSYQIVAKNADEAIKMHAAMLPRKK